MSRETSALAALRESLVFRSQLVLEGWKGQKGGGDWLRIGWWGGGVSRRLWSLWDVLEREWADTRGGGESGLAAWILRKQMGEKLECVCVCVC